MNKLAVLLLLLTFWFVEYQFNQEASANEFWVTQAQLDKQRALFEAEMTKYDFIINL